MHNKLRGNANKFPSKTEKVTYAVSKIGGDAKSLILKKIKPSTTHPFISIEKVFNTLKNNHSDPDKRTTTRRAIKKITQAKLPFH